MALLSPWLLLALGAVGVPLAVHLVSREPRSGAAFPSLMFVSRVPVPTRRRRHLRDRPLLALRCLALALLALAFAGPHLTVAPGPARPDAAVATVVALDRSHSMVLGSGWDAAREAARSALAAAPAGEPTALLLFDTEQQLIVDTGAALATVTQTVAPSARGTDLAGALEAAGRWLDERNVAERRIVLLSDLQRTGLADGRRARLAAGTVVTAIPFADADGARSAIVHARTHAGSTEARLHIEAAIRTAPGPALDPADVTLEVQGREVDTLTVSRAAGGIDRVSFEVAAPASRPVHVRLVLAAGASVAAGAHHMVLAPRTPVRVVVVATGAQPSTDFLARALEVASAPRMLVRVLGPDEASAPALEAADVVVVDDVPFAGPFVDALRARVEAGAGLVVFAGDRIRGAWPSGPGGLLPGTLGARVDQSEDPARIVRGSELPAGLEATKVRGHRTLVPGPADRIVAALDDGAALALERDRGAGRVVAFALTLDPGWSTLAREPGFVPLVHDLVRTLAGVGEVSAAHTVGNAVDLVEQASGPAGSEALAARLRAGAPVIVRTPAGAERQHDASRPLRLGEAGIYEVRSGEEVMHVAANVDAREIDLAPLTPDTLEERIARVAPGRADSEADEARLNSAHAQRWWWRLLVLATILLAIEAWLANRLSVARTSGRGPAVGGSSIDEPAGVH